ncbi:MAG: hypothetical protein KF723_20975 [Rhizobiaceae bacterium]|nr:hypothetical protein [Rhizobiaceae bacterium]
MEHIAAVLLIIGCSDDLSQCRELPAPVALYETAQECETGLPVSLRGRANEYPQLFAQCLVVDPALEEEDVVLSWGIRNDGMLVASVGVPDVMVATNSSGTAVGNLRQE